MKTTKTVYLYNCPNCKSIITSEQAKLELWAGKNACCQEFMNDLNIGDHCLRKGQQYKVIARMMEDKELMKNLKKVGRANLRGLLQIASMSRYWLESVEKGKLVAVIKGCAASGTKQVSFFSLTGAYPYHFFYFLNCFGYKQGKDNADYTVLPFINCDPIFMANYHICNRLADYGLISSKKASILVQRGVYVV